MELNSASNVIFKDCAFTGVDNTSSVYDMLPIRLSDHIYFIDCSFDLDNQTIDQQNDLMRVQGSSHILFLRCDFGNSTHDTFAVRRAREETYATGGTTTQIYVSTHNYKTNSMVGCVAKFPNNEWVYETITANSATTITLAGNIGFTISDGTKFIVEDDNITSHEQFIVFRKGAMHNEFHSGLAPGAASTKRMVIDGMTFYNQGVDSDNTPYTLHL